MRTLGPGCLSLRICPWNLCRERLAIGPYSPILEVFLLPDRHRPLQSIDQPSASVERRSPVCGCDHDQYAGLADLEPSQTMHDGNISNLKLFQSLISKCFQ